MTCLLCAWLLGTAAADTAAAPGEAVFVLNRVVEPGDIVSDADFAPQADSGTATAVTARYALSPKEAAGREAVRRLSAGAVVRQGDVRTPQPVKRGDSVVIAIRSGSLSITGQGRALSGGALGEQVRITSDATRRTLQAVVEGPRRVHILSE